MSGSEGLAGDLHDLAGGWGVAAAVQYSIDHLPGSRTGDVGYDFSIAVGLLVGDLAEVVETSGLPDEPGPEPAPTDSGRARESADSAAAVTASALATTVLRPFVHPWMVVDPAYVRHAVHRLDDLLPRLESALARAQVDPQAAETTVAALGDVRAAFADLVAALESDGRDLRRLLRDRPMALRRLRSHTDRLGEADALCRRRLEDATCRLPDLRGLLAGSRWDSPRLAADRSALSGVPTTEARRLIARDPDLVAVLTDPADTGATPWLAEALVPANEGGAGAGDDVPAHAVSLLQVARVRRACAEQTDDELDRVALLYPRLVGGLDGVPPTVRTRANRLVMRADLRRMRATDVALQHQVSASRERDSSSPLRRARGALLDVWLANDEITALATLDHDRPNALRVEHRAMVTLTQQLLHDRADQGRGVRAHRQVLQYAPSGRVVELWGLLDEDTTRVAVYVGGTGTTVRQFGWPTGIARALQRADASGRTAVITWMGAEFPSAIGTHAPSGRFARLAAAPLRDLVEGLDVPDGTPITVVGHSYGGVIVGAAEALGLRVDTVVHAGVPGIGPGLRSVAEYPDHDALGRPRHVVRYCLTAPGDLIRLWRRGDAAVSSLSTLSFTPARSAAGWFGERTLGADPTTLLGIRDLDTGIWEVDKDDRRAGEILYGPRGHADVVEPGTTSFRRIVAAVQGEDPAAVTPPATLRPFRWRPGRG
ncbi:alpha/beta hydrolase [Mobilicoccus caccae]|uniref:DUF1023 domain-containing protein n=1 Tax=Mobilicoccus caccae TaxID=1859295 RepID=A0ABQ6IRB8_9MICO|nr:alpha/beta hydrolase [Mobilicoccus caccae]GMA40452.1 hypothetical protein GCM10025883_24970 [Mobilicoccus caccae]